MPEIEGARAWLATLSPPLSTVNDYKNLQEEIDDQAEKTVDGINQQTYLNLSNATKERSNRISILTELKTLLRPSETSSVDDLIARLETYAHAQEIRQTLSEEIQQVSLNLHNLPWSQQAPNLARLQQLKSQATQIDLAVRQVDRLQSGISNRLRSLLIDPDAHAIDLFLSVGLGRQPNMRFASSGVDSDIVQSAFPSIVEVAAADVIPYGATWHRHPTPLPRFVEDPQSPTNSETPSIPRQDLSPHQRHTNLPQESRAPQAALTATLFHDTQSPIFQFMNGIQSLMESIRTNSRSEGNTLPNTLPTSLSREPAHATTPSAPIEDFDSARSFVFSLLTRSPDSAGNHNERDTTEGI